MNQPEVEFFSEDVDGEEYLNVGFKFYVPTEEEPVRCVLGAFSIVPKEDGLRIIKSLVEEAAIYMQGVYSGEIKLKVDEPQLEVVTPRLEVVTAAGGGAGVEG